MAPDRKGRWQVWLAILQRLAGDTAGAKATAEEALKTLESLDERLPGNPNIVLALSLAKAELGEKDSALKEAERAIMLAPSDKNPVERTRSRRNPGANSHAIRREWPRDLNSHAAITNAIYRHHLLPNAHYTGAFKARSALGPFARRSRFPKTLPGKAAVKLQSFFAELKPR